MRPDDRQIQAIAALCDQRWERHYTLSKLRTDPVYAAVAREISTSPLPVLDIGCGIGLLAHYLHACGSAAPVIGFDYDERKIAMARRMAAQAGQTGWEFAAGDARTGLPDFRGNVVILDILQFFQRHEQEALLRAAAARLARGGRLVIRTGLHDEDSWRFHLTVLGDLLARATAWMKAAPICYPDAEFLRRVLTNSGLMVRIEALWGGTPFNNFLVVAAEATTTAECAVSQRFASGDG